MATRKTQKTAGLSSPTQERLVKAAKQAPKAEVQEPKPEGKAKVEAKREAIDAARERTLKAAKGLGLVAEQTGGFVKLTGKAKGKRVCVARKGGTVFLVGFCVSAEGVTPITEEQAKERHIGKARGELDLGDVPEASVLKALAEAAKEV